MVQNAIPLSTAAISASPLYRRRKSEPLGNPTKLDLVLLKPIPFSACENLISQLAQLAKG